MLFLFSFSNVNSEETSVEINKFVAGKISDQSVVEIHVLVIVKNFENKALEECRKLKCILTARYFNTETGTSSNSTNIDYMGGSDNSREWLVRFQIDGDADKENVHRVLIEMSGGATASEYLIVSVPSKPIYTLTPVRMGQEWVQIKGGDNTIQISLKAGDAPATNINIVESTLKNADNGLKISGNSFHLRGNGNVNPNSEETLSFNVSTENIHPGTYSGNVFLSSDEALTPTAYELTLHVSNLFYRGSYLIAA